VRGRDLGQRPAQPAAEPDGHAGQQLRVDVPGRPGGLLAQLLPGPGQLDDPAPPVAGRRHPADRAQLLELVQDVHDDARRHPYPAGQVQLGPAARGGQLEHGAVPRLQPDVGQLVGEKTWWRGRRASELEGEAAGYRRSSGHPPMIGAAGRDPAGRTGRKAKWGR
jgi:hypothetical protein